MSCRHCWRGHCGAAQGRKRRSTTGRTRDNEPASCCSPRASDVGAATPRVRVRMSPLQHPIALRRDIVEITPVELSRKIHCHVVDLLPWITFRYRGDLSERKRRKRRWCTKGFPSLRDIYYSEQVWWGRCRERLIISISLAN